MFKASILLVSTMLLSVVALGNETKQCPNDGKDYKECKLARKNDQGASKYLLMENGQFLRITDDNGVKCTIDQDVVDFKVSQHPTDRAVVYYIKRNGDMNMVNNVDGDSNGGCLKVVKKTLMEDTKEFSVISNADTTIVNAALSKSGVFKAWDAATVVYQDRGVLDYQMNNCYGKQGKSFSSYGLFTLDSNGIITKVKGEAQGQSQLVADARDNSRFGSIKEFIDARNVCK